MHTPGKDLTITKTLLRASTTTTSHANTQDIAMFVNTALSCLPATEKWLIEITQKQEEDEVCKQLKKYCSQMA